MAARKTPAKKAATKKTGKTAAKKPRKAAPKRRCAKAARDNPGKPLDPYVGYSDAIADQVCAHIVEGKSILAISLIKGMPSKAAIFRWLGKHDEFRVKYEVATSDRAQFRYENIDHIINELRVGMIDARAARVMVDTVKWQCAIERPQRYGQVSRHELTGRGGGPIRSQNLPSEMSPDERMDEIKRLASENPELFSAATAAPTES